MEKKVQSRTLPYSLEAEQSLLGCIMLDSNISLELTSQFKEDDFYSKSHRLIFGAMLGLVKKAKPIDIVTLADELSGRNELEQCGGYDYLTTIMQSVPGAANYKYYGEMVQRDSLRRRVIDAAAGISERAFASEKSSDVLAFAEKSIYDISVGQDNSSLVNLKDSFADVMVKFSTIQSDKNAYRGLMTGFTDLDKLTNGLQKSDLVLVAARPAVGKTSFATNIIENISVLGSGVSAVFSLEMSKQQLAQRMICSVANVSMERALKGGLTVKDWEELWKANELVSRSKMFVDDSALITPREMLSKCRRLQLMYGLDVIMIDYIQLMQGDDKSRGRESNRQQEVSEISRNLKIMAKELNVPVIALSQLSREAEKENKPQLSHLRESGAIEQDADIVMFIHRPDKIDKNQDKVKSGEIMKDVAEIIIAKHRNGATDTIKLKWIGPMTKFVNFRPEDDQLEKTYNLNREQRQEHDEEKRRRMDAGEMTEGLPPFDMDAELKEMPSGDYVAAQPDDLLE